MDKPVKSDNSDVTHKLAAVVVVIFMSFAGWGMIHHYFRSKLSSEKLTSLRYHGNWSVGEYRECNSMNLREEDEKPDVFCMEPFPSDPPKIFIIKFTGGPTYDSAIVEGAVHFWLCRRDNSDVSFSCVKEKETKNEKQSEAEPIMPPVQHDLSRADIQYFKKRNECEQRFYDKEVYLANGMSVGKACKQNSELKP